MHTLTAIPQPVSAARTLRGTVVHCPGRSQRAAAAALRLLGLRPLRFLGTPGRWACIVSARPGALVPPYLPQPAPAARPAPAAARTPGHPMPAAASSSALPSFAAAWITILLSLSLSLLAPVDKAESATVLSNIYQDSGESAINYTFQNNDPGATYNSATLDLNTILGLVVNNIVANNPAYSSTADVYKDIGLNITNTGDVSFGWSSAINSSTGLMSLTNNGIEPNETFTVWSHPRTMTGTLNLGNMLDYNGNGIIDPNETLAFSGTADNAFTGYSQTGLTQWQADAQRITIIPEPSSALLGGLGALALLRRRREPRSVFPCVTSREGKGAA